MLGFTASAAPLGRGDIARYVDVFLILHEAERIGISVEPIETDRAWAAAVTRAGGEATVQRWLDDNAIDRDWARHVIEREVQRQKFLAERFAAFVIPSEDDITRALAPGQTDEAAREQARERASSAPRPRRRRPSGSRARAGAPRSAS